MKKLAIITGVLEELNASNEADDYSIGAILRSKLFDTIVLAVPKGGGDTTPLKNLAERHKIKYFEGEPNNIAKRFREVLNIWPADIVCRFQLRASWVDIQLVKRSVDIILKGFDYADYDYSVNYAMGCDSFSISAFLKMERILSGMNQDDPLTATFQFSPWACMQNPAVFRVGVVQAPEKYSEARALAIRRRLDFLIGHKQNMIGSPVDKPALRYIKTASLLDKNWNVAEISSGTGGGAAYLSQYCKTLTAYEINPTYVEYAKCNYSNYPVIYALGGSETLNQLNDFFDCVISLHTLEHVPDDYIFLTHINQSMRRQGCLILEVPRLMERPMGMPLWPFHEREYLPHDVRRLLKSCGFAITQELGVSRNNYVDIAQAREAMMFIARKTT